MASGSSGVADAGTAHGAEGMAAGSPAVVGRVFTMDDLALISQAQKQERGHDQPWALNNQALKWLRWMGEDPVGVPTCRRWEFDFAGLLTIGVMDHDVKGARLLAHCGRVCGAVAVLEPCAVFESVAFIFGGGVGPQGAWGQTAHI